ncbi:MAG: ParB N-terminal domain-containing protein [Litorimonas sp.]
MISISIAPVDNFVFARPRILVGKLLQDIKTLQNSILKYGLLSPIIVREHNGKLVVVDGRKRLAAIRRLRFLGQLPRSLVNIPYTELSTHKGIESPTPALMSNRELYNTVTQAFADGNDEGQIAKDLYLSRRCIQQILTLTRLSPMIRGLFFERVINFNQARRYAGEPRQTIQNTVFKMIGPFALIEEISQALQNIGANLAQLPTGKTVQPMRLAA